VLAFLALRRSTDRSAPQDAEPLPPADEMPPAVLTSASVSGSRT
jgi:hypothetical protein